ncbi:MAG: formimidoylglutamase [Deltaproteobacteria bacterium]|nr:formimidoylglutamase [Deltaproteobacteria bacterium]
MTVIDRYLKPDMTLWQGRPDAPSGSAMFQIAQALDLSLVQPGQIKRPGFALIGFACDEGVKRNRGRPGAVGGPPAARRAFARLPVHREGVALYDAGDITCNDGNLEAAQQTLAGAIGQLHEQGLTPLLVGGGHELAYGHFLGLTKSFPGQVIATVNIDAHLDMRPLIEQKLASSGTPFLQAADLCKRLGIAFNYACIGAQPSGNTKMLFETARHHQVEVVTAQQIEPTIDSVAAHILSQIGSKHEVNYLTICLDAFSVAVAPGVSAPQPTGLNPTTVLPWIRLWAGSGNFRSYDLAELCPLLDQDQKTERLAAQLLFEIFHHHKFVDA